MFLFTWISAPWVMPIKGPRNDEENYKVTGIFFGFNDEFQRGDRFMMFYTFVGSVTGAYQTLSSGYGGGDDWDQ